MTALLLVLVFIPVFILSQTNDRVVELIGTASIKCLNGQFYRWFTCIFFHYSFFHIFFNSAALISVGSLVSPFIGKLRTLIIFILGGALAEVPYSLIVHYGEVSYGGGSSGGIFALIAAFLVCWLRWPGEFRLKWYRPDLLIVLVYFILANDDQGSFLTHVFGFTAGIILTTLLVICRLVKDKHEPQSQITPEG